LFMGGLWRAGVFNSDSASAVLAHGTRFCRVPGRSQTESRATLRPASEAG
jgi:hypothetical protein